MSMQGLLVHRGPCASWCRLILVLHAAEGWPRLVACEDIKTMGYWHGPRLNLEDIRKFLKGGGAIVSVRG